MFINYLKSRQKWLGIYLQNCRDFWQWFWQFAKWLWLSCLNIISRTLIHCNYKSKRYSRKQIFCWKLLRLGCADRTKKGIRNENRENHLNTENEELINLDVSISYDVLQQTMIWWAILTFQAYAECEISESLSQCNLLLGNFIRRCSCNIEYKNIFRGCKKRNRYVRWCI